VLTEKVPTSCMPKLVEGCGCKLLAKFATLEEFAGERGLVPAGTASTSGYSRMDVTFLGAPLVEGEMSPIKVVGPLMFKAGDQVQLGPPMLMLPANCQTCTRLGAKPWVDYPTRSRNAAAMSNKWRMRTPPTKYEIL